MDTTAKTISTKPSFFAFLKEPRGYFQSLGSFFSGKTFDIKPENSATVLFITGEKKPESRPFGCKIEPFLKFFKVLMTGQKQ